MQTVSLKPIDMFSALSRHRALTIASIRRDVVGRYRGSFLGILWSFFNPLLLLSVYTVVFGLVYQSRWGEVSGSIFDFALLLFAGLIVFNFFQECLNRAPALVLSSPNFVKKVVFPLEILPWVAIGSALFHALVSLVVWLLAYVLLIGWPHISIVLLPFTLIPLVMMVLGLSWFLASLGVFLRDTSHVISIITTVFLFLTPIFYPPAALQKSLPWLLNVNPLFPFVESARNLLFFGILPDFIAIARHAVLASLVAWGGFIFFQKTRSGFADVV